LYNGVPQQRAIGWIIGFLHQLDKHFEGLELHIPGPVRGSNLPVRIYYARYAADDILLGIPRTEGIHVEQPAKYELQRKLKHIFNHFKLESSWAEIRIGGQKKIGNLDSGCLSH
jgi:hypothetical protein